MESTGPVVIDLTGPQGNAYYLLGAAADYAKALGYKKNMRDKILEEMKSGDYENLVQVFDSYFGDFVILDR